MREECQGRVRGGGDDVGRRHPREIHREIHLRLFGDVRARFGSRFARLEEFPLLRLEERARELGVRPRVAPPRAARRDAALEVRGDEPRTRAAGAKKAQRSFQRRRALETGAARTASPKPASTARIQGTCLAASASRFARTVPSETPSPSPSPPPSPSPSPPPSPPKNRPAPSTTRRRNIEVGYSAPNPSASVFAAHRAAASAAPRPNADSCASSSPARARAPDPFVTIVPSRVPRPPLPLAPSRNTVPGEMTSPKSPSPLAAPRRAARARARVRGPAPPPPRPSRSPPTRPAPPPRRSAR